MGKTKRLALGLDFGTESVRALLVDLDGREHGSSTAKFKHGQIIRSLPGAKGELPADFALQHPIDWIDSAAKAVRGALRQCSISPSAIVGLGVDFTSCTMLPAREDGTPLCMQPKFARVPYAWPKLWKHHGAKTQTDRINEVARRRKEKWLSCYGGVVGLEWFFPKILETLENAPTVYRATDVWLEAGDWFVWRLVGGPADQLPRSTCQAGYKAMYSHQSGYPSRAFLRAVHPDLADVVRDKMPGRLLSPGERAGNLIPAMAKKFGLPEGLPISAATIDAHAGVPGAGVAGADTMVMVLGTSSCHMLNSKQEKNVPGVAGVVKDGILPGFFGYEMGQAAVGDAFDWLRVIAGEKDFRRLDAAAAQLPPGAEGVRCVDWMNGCRTPLMDGTLAGTLTGLTLRHQSAHLYRALIEATAFGLKWIVDLMRNCDVPVKKFVATGGLPHHNPLLVQIYADVLEKPITVHPSKQGPALGAAILGALAAGRKATGLSSATSAVRGMAAARDDQPGRRAKIVRPNRRFAKTYQGLYTEYRDLAAFIAGNKSC